MLGVQVWGMEGEQLFPWEPKGKGQLDDLVLLLGADGKGDPSSVLGLRGLGPAFGGSVWVRRAVRSCLWLLAFLRSKVLVWRGGVF